MREVVIGVIGCGYWGPNVLRSFAAIEGCRVKRAADRKSGRLQFVAERFPQLVLSADHRDVLADPEIHAVCVVTPVSTHHEIALAALRAGKHVLVEKPLAVRTEQAVEIVACARERGLIVGVGHLFEYHPAITCVRQAISEGAVGEIAYLDATRINLGPPASEVSVLWDLAPHDVSLLLLLAGESPETITTFAGHYCRDGMIDAAFLHLGFRGGRMGQIHVSWLSSNKTRRLWVMGTSGSILYDDMASEKVRIFDQGFDSRIGAADHEAKVLAYRPAKVTVPRLADIEPLQLECQEFVNAVRTGSPPRADAESGLRVVQVLAAAERSLARGSVPVTVVES
jgi:predicted dehydrogenase